MSDRTNNYIPDPHHGELTPQYHALVGHPTNKFGMTRVPVATGLPDQHNRGPGYQEWAQVDPGSADGTPEHWSKFEGWDVLVGIELSTWNEREVNDWKGRDEIRKSGAWTLTFNGQPVCGDVGRFDPFSTLAKIGRIANRLRNISVIDWRKDDYRSQIEGRRVYYRDQPAQLGFWMPKQGCVMVHAVGEDFRPSAYDIDEQTGTDGNPERSYSDESRREVKTHLDSGDIWWWRDRMFGDETEGHA